MSFRIDIKQGRRFEFGKNWLEYVSNLDEGQVREAEKSLIERIGKGNFKKKSFLDIGCGSGIFSLAAKNLGAKVVSFDFDEYSVECAKILKERFYKDDNNWIILEGSVLDKSFIKDLGKFDIVYSWGVLHHTGDMWRALNNTITSVSELGVLFIALYNDQGIKSRYWKLVKFLYVKQYWTRPLWIFLHLIYPAGPSFIIKKLRRKKIPRGMSFWRDLTDWLGGYPFEVASRDKVEKFVLEKNFKTQQIVSAGSKLGCNEFIFKKN